MTQTELQAAEAFKILHAMMKHCPLHDTCRGTKQLRYWECIHCNIEANPRGRELKLGHKLAVELLSERIGDGRAVTGSPPSGVQHRGSWGRAWDEATS